jgi:uncharacterized protein
MYLERTIETKIRKHLNRKEFTIITGARQTGKTTLIQKIFQDTKKANKKCFYISFENIEILQNINEHPENIFKYAVRPPDPLIERDVPVVLFIDEIQYAAKPSNFLKYLYDKYLENLKIVATGSSAFYIDSGFDDSLAGRKRIFTLRTLSFDEYLGFSDQQRLREELYLIRKQNDYVSVFKHEIIDAFDQYLVFGGYPAVALENEPDEKIALLGDIKNSFMKKDIDESGISNRDAFFKLFTLLSGQTANLLNKNELANTIGIDNKTIDHYLTILRKCFHIELVKPFSGNLRKELTKMPKVYFYDNGLRNSMLNNFTRFENRLDQGVLLENYVFTRLADMHEPENIRFWRTTDKKEVDFVLTSDFKSGKAYEVKTDGRLRIKSGYRNFLDQYPGFEFELLTYAFRDDSRQVLRL